MRINLVKRDAITISTSSDNPGSLTHASLANVAYNIDIKLGSDFLKNFKKSGKITKQGNCLFPATLDFENII